jgi:hypothetical protein
MVTTWLSDRDAVGKLTIGLVGDGFRAAMNK